MCRPLAQTVILETKGLSSGAGTSGCVVAGRIAEDTNARILLVEAGPHNKDLENVHMVGGKRSSTS